jgi:hypothetical protein
MLTKSLLSINANAMRPIRIPIKSVLSCRDITMGSNNKVVANNIIFRASKTVEKPRENLGTILNEGKSANSRE